MELEIKPRFDNVSIRNKNKEEENDFGKRILKEEKSKVGISISYEYRVDDLGHIVATRILPFESMLVVDK